MKNLFLKLTLIFAIIFTLTSCDKEENVSADVLPVTATSFIKEHFAATNIVSTKREKEGSVYEFDVVLSNGVELSFDESGVWRSAEARVDAEALSSTTFIPAKILAHVTENYANLGINGISKENTGYDVELTNGVDLEFDLDGNFVRID